MESSTFPTCACWTHEWDEMVRMVWIWAMTSSDHPSFFLGLALFPCFFALSYSFFSSLFPLLFPPVFPPLARSASLYLLSTSASSQFPPLCPGPPSLSLSVVSQLSFFCLSYSTAPPLSITSVDSFPLTVSLWGILTRVCVCVCVRKNTLYSSTEQTNSISVWLHSTHISKQEKDQGKGSVTCSQSWDRP